MTAVWQALKVRFLLALAGGAALAAGSLGCGSNKACDDLCTVQADRIRECCSNLGSGWCIAEPGTEEDWIADCRQDYATAISAAKVEDRNGIRNQCATDILDVSQKECSELIDRYDDLWDEAHGDDDTAADDDSAQ